MITLTLFSVFCFAQSTYDVSHYDLSVSFDLENQSISGHNTISFSTDVALDTFVFHLSDSFEIASIVYQEKDYTYSRKGNSVFVPIQLEAAELHQLTISYSGMPHPAANAPWDGGFVWKKDEKDRHWVSVACEGMGAQAWWPCTNDLRNRPDSMDLHFKTPLPNRCISNGQLIDRHHFKGKEYTHWKVSYPINTYNATFYLGHYNMIQDYLVINKDSLSLQYYVLDYHHAKARTYFKQNIVILKTIHELYGEFPFKRDGYKLVEAPYLGMEHQTAIAWGGDFKNTVHGYNYILLHENGHEWWGNSIGMANYQNMWINEGFTTYTEALFVETIKGISTAQQYLNNQKRHINNQQAIVDACAKKDYSDTDQYYKGAWLLHTLRHALNQEDWRAVMHQIFQQYKGKLVEENNIIEYFNALNDFDVNPLFEQYLHHKEVPILEYQIEQHWFKTKIKFRWTECIKSFNLPVTLTHKEQAIRVYPITDTWQTSSFRHLRKKQFVPNTDLGYFELKLVN